MEKQVNKVLVEIQKVVTLSGVMKSLLMVSAAQELVCTEQTVRKEQCDVIVWPVWETFPASTLQNCPPDNGKKDKILTCS